MFIKHAVRVAVIPQHTGLEEVLRARGNRLSPSGEQEGGGDIKLVFRAGGLYDNVAGTLLLCRRSFRESYTGGKC